MRFNQLMALSVFCFASTVLCCGCGSEREGGSAPSASISGSSTDSEGADFSGTSPTDPLRPEVIVTTSLGEFQIELDVEAAPGTVSNFLNYVTDRHYDGTTFHYASKESMILGGAFTLDGKEKLSSPPIRSEAFNGLKNVRGSVAINRYPDQIDSATCQFFVNVRDNPKFDYRAQKKNPEAENNEFIVPKVSTENYGYCVFGRVTSGMEVVDKIAAQETGTEESRKGSSFEPVVIRSIRLAGQSTENHVYGGVELQR